MGLGVQNKIENIGSKGFSNLSPINSSPKPQQTIIKRAFQYFKMKINQGETKIHICCSYIVNHVGGALRFQNRFF